MCAVAKKPLTEEDIGGAEHLVSTLLAQRIWKVYGLRLGAVLGVLLAVVILLVVMSYRGANEALAKHQALAEQWRERGTDRYLAESIRKDREANENHYKALMAAVESLRRSVDRLERR